MKQLQFEFNKPRIKGRVAVTTDIESTGIKKDMKGSIIAIQDGSRAVGRWTDLGDYAIQVRFNTIDLKAWEQRQRALRPERSVTAPAEVRRYG